MPHTGPIPRDPDPQIQARLEAREAFIGGFSRSRNGNLYRKWEGLTLTVFRSRDGDTFRWCISGENGPQWSQESYEEEQDALSELGKELMAW